MIVNLFQIMIYTWKNSRKEKIVPEVSNLNSLIDSFLVPIF